MFTGCSCEFYESFCLCDSTICQRKNWFSQWGRETGFLSIFSGLNSCYSSNRTCTPNSGLFVLKRSKLSGQFTVSSQRLWLFFTCSKGFPGGAVLKSPANAGGTADAGLIPGLGRSSAGGIANLLHSSCLEIPWTGEPSALRSLRSQSQTQLRTHSAHLL